MTTNYYYRLAKIFTECYWMSKCCGNELVVPSPMRTQAYIEQVESLFPRYGHRLSLTLHSIMKQELPNMEKAVAFFETAHETIMARLCIWRNSFEFMITEVTSGLSFLASISLTAVSERVAPVSRTSGQRYRTRDSLRFTRYSRRATTKRPAAKSTPHPIRVRSFESRGSQGLAI